MSLRRSLAAWFIVLLPIAIVSWLANAVALDAIPWSWVPVSIRGFVPAIGWSAFAIACVALIAAPIFLRWRSLWLLPLFPVAAFYPVLAMMIVGACMQNSANCP